MRIAQIAPLIESVPPRLYGGTERGASHLTGELVRPGPRVTLFASGDSITSAELVACSTRLDPAVRDPIPYYMLMLDKVRPRADELEILHFHLDLLHFPMFRPITERTLTTLHDRLDLPDLRPFYRAFHDNRWCRSPLPSVPRLRTPTSWRRSTTACRSICITRPSIRADATWRSL